MKKFTLILLIFLLAGEYSYASFWESFQKLLETPSQKTQNKLSDSEVRKGLQEALTLALKRAVSKASQEGGFLNNPDIRIPLPPKLARVANFLRKYGLRSQVEAFEASMNHAAERAAKEAFPVFLKAVKDLTLKDVKNLLYGGDHAVTEYFRQKTWDDLYVKFQPIVKENLDKVGVTRKYQEIISDSLVSTYLKNTDLELDHYVTQKSLEGLFKLLAEEEKRIRQDPAARTTALLKKVFSSLSKNTK
ncbi:DUF4197 domain-containing protein [Thermodesulfatator atlanticus]|uniref:DUF4197 domain-containing protein n=1 Tax=Thermodesulfatator atlanticus TaxID=501497 RepID=UPI0003B3439D|nr:DUF4197 domain-containing protein [Thermodesulfatator atlanticus]